MTSRMSATAASRATIARMKVARCGRRLPSAGDDILVRRETGQRRVAKLDPVAAAVVEHDRHHGIASTSLDVRHGTWSPATVIDALPRGDGVEPRSGCPAARPLQLEVSAADLGDKSARRPEPQLPAQ